MKKFLFTILSILILATTLAGQEISFNLTPEEEAEKASWIAKGLMYPKYGYDKVSWGDGVDEVKKHYTGLVNTSDEDSLFGMRKFSQKANSGGMVKREFYFYQEKLFKVEISYDNSVKEDLLEDKIKSTFDKDVYGGYVLAGRLRPGLNSAFGRYCNKVGCFIYGEEKENSHYNKNSYAMVIYRHHDSVDAKISKLRQKLKKDQESLDNQKQIDALGI